MRLESFRNTLHRIAGPLPRPAAHEIVPLGGRAGEREGQGETKIPQPRFRQTGSHVPQAQKYVEIYQFTPI